MLSFLVGLFTCESSFNVSVILSADKIFSRSVRSRDRRNSYCHKDSINPWVKLRNSELPQCSLSGYSQLHSITNPCQGAGPKCQTAKAPRVGATAGGECLFLPPPVHSWLTPFFRIPFACFDGLCLQLVGYGSCLHTHLAILLILTLAKAFSYRDNFNPT